jgi:hypothetical protein
MLTGQLESLATGVLRCRPTRTGIVATHRDFRVVTGPSVEAG